MADGATEPSRDRGVEVFGIHPLPSGGRGRGANTLVSTGWQQKMVGKTGVHGRFSRVALHDVRLPTDRRSITSASAASPTVTATAATVAATAATTTATATAATAVAATAATTIFTGFGFVDGQASSIMLLIVKPLDGRLSLSLGVHLDEPEPFASARRAVLNDLRSARCRTARTTAPEWSH